MDNHDNINPDDREFLSLAGSAGLLEVELGKLALQKTSNGKIISFAQEMVKEHTRFNKEFVLMLKKIHEKIPLELNQSNKEQLESFSKMTGEEFDKAYVDFMVNDHKNAVNLFDKFLKTAKNQVYKKFLEDGSRIVKHHYKMAKKLKEETFNKKF
jgi:putative membrane protein